MARQQDNSLAIQDLVDNFNLGVFRQNGSVQGKFIFANAVLCKVLGYSQAEIIKKQAASIFFSKQRYEALIKKAEKAKTVIREEVRLKAKKSKVVWCLLSLAATKDSKGKIKYFDGIVEDITEQRRVEKELNESKELFKTVFDNSASAIMVTDEHEKIIAWNSFAEEMLGMKKKDLFNKPVEELYPAQEWRRMRSLHLKKKGKISDWETQVYTKDGKVLDVNMSISMIKDTKGNVQGSIGIMNDITKQKTAERKIKESENKIRIILDNSAAAITLTDENERIISWNRYTEQLLGMKKADLNMRAISSLYPTEEWEKIRQANIRKSGSKHHLETKIVRKDGTMIDIDLSVNVLKDSSNNIIGSVGIIHDITEQKRFQQMLLQAKITAEEANSAKSLFLANMSHEVRTPLNTIVGMVDLTLDTVLNEEQKDNLLTVKDAADVLLSLLNDILDLSRVEAGKIELEKIEMNIRNIVQSVCKGLSVLARNKNLEIEWTMASDVPEIIIGDPVRVRQILVNLINNAIKFTFKGKIRVSIKVSEKDQETCDLEFSVRDEGVGIPKEKIKTIFDDFTQADISTTRKFGGTGLGLSISKKLVEMMDGRIWVASEEFSGSTFSFVVKFFISQEETNEETSPEVIIEEAAEVKKDIKSLSILLAEDNIVNQKMVVRMLEKKGWVVQAVGDGKHVLEYLAKQTFDLILMDAQMPELDGFETTRLIREGEKQTGKRIPIVALTARAMAEDRKKCLACGMDGYVSKPIDRQQLYETIENYF